MARGSEVFVRMNRHQDKRNLANLDIASLTKIMPKGGFGTNVFRKPLNNQYVQCKAPLVSWLILLSPVPYFLFTLSDAL
jgi:hypothetical protein